LKEEHELKRFLFAHLYSHENLNGERRRLTACIRDLFAYFLKRPQSLPAHYFQQSQKEPLNRVVCDYIAGMTDPYLQEQYRRLLGN
jgi:dGTPase